MAMADMRVVVDSAVSLYSTDVFDAARVFVVVSCACVVVEVVNCAFAAVLANALRKAAASASPTSEIFTTRLASSHSSATTVSLTQLNGVEGVFGVAVAVPEHHELRDAHHLGREHRVDAQRERRRHGHRRAVLLVPVPRDFALQRAEILGELGETRLRARSRARSRSVAGPSPPPARPGASRCCCFSSSTLCRRFATSCSESDAR